MKFKLNDVGSDTRTVLMRGGVRVDVTGNTYETTDKDEIAMLKSMEGVEVVKPKRDND